MNVSNVNRDSSVDFIISELNKIFNEKYLPRKNSKFLYDSLVVSIKELDSITCNKDLSYVIKDIINYNSTLMNHQYSEQARIVTILAIFAVVVTVVSEISLTFVFTIAILLISIIQFYVFCSSKKIVEKKCFYELVYNILFENK
jgi:hypothetical protein